MTPHARPGPFDGQIVAYSGEQRLELWVQSAGFLDGFDVYLGGVLMAGEEDNRTHVFPIDRRAELMVVFVRFHGPRGGSSAIVDVRAPNRKVQERPDHCYLLQGV
ncbi:MAG: hypothetical protein ABI895_16070 [Deltaproteobacteria bacterium]